MERILRIMVMEKVTLEEAIFLDSLINDLEQVKQIDVAVVNALTLLEEGVTAPKIIKMLDDFIWTESLVGLSELQLGFQLRDMLEIHEMVFRLSQVI